MHDNALKLALWLKKKKGITVLCVNYIILKLIYLICLF